jgi:hypothetical protein
MAGPAPLTLALRWPGKVLEEILLAPWTVAKVRRSLTELPERIDALRDSLDETTSMLTGTLPDLDGRLLEVAGDLTAFRVSLERLLPELSKVVTGMDERFRNVESTVSELGDGVLNVLGSIPGVRRALRDPRTNHPSQ